jgi:hypothetical protein
MAQINRGGPSRFFPARVGPQAGGVKPSRLNPPATPEETPQGVSSGVVRNNLPLPKGGKLPFDIPTGQSRPISPEHEAFLATRVPQQRAQTSGDANAGAVIVAMGHLSETIRELIKEVVSLAQETREIRLRMESEMQAEMREEAQELPEETPQG